MTRFQLILAIAVSAALIGGSTWIRIQNRIETNSGELIAEETQDFSESYSNDGLALINTTHVLSEPLSETDLIGRQLFSDYAKLLSTGQATSENLTALAESYTASIKNTKYIPNITTADLLIVEDTETNLQIYGESVFNIHTKYKNLVTKAHGSGITPNVNSPEFKSFMERVAELYTQAANELKILPVPQILAETHFNLVNNNLSSAEAATTLSNIVKDPLSAYAALNTQAENTQKEANLLLYIQSTMMANGIISANGI